MMETADLTGISMKSVMGPINYRPLKLLGSPGLIVEPSKHQTSIARIRLATPAQLREVDKLLEPKELELPDAAYEELRIQMDPAILTVCTVPYNMKADQHAMEMNTKVRNLNEVIRQIHQRSVLPVGLLDVAEQMERAAFPDDASSDGIHFDRPRGVEWLNDVFQRHISALEVELLETPQFTFGPPPNPPFLASRTLSSRLGARADSRDSSRSRRTRLPGVAPMEAEEATLSTPQSSVVSSVVVVESKRVERPAETSRSRYLEKVKELDLEDLECRQELAEALGLERVSHEDLSRHQCVDWLKAHERHFSRARIMETADLTGIPTR